MAHLIGVPIPINSMVNFNHVEFINSNKIYLGKITVRNFKLNFRN